MWTRLASLGIFAAVVGCNSARPHGPTVDGASTGAFDFSTLPSGDLAGGGSDCSERAKLIYVVDQDNMLSSFDPMSLTFQNIGTLKCPAMVGSAPNSMAVDRSAIAWVNYSSGELFRVDTSNVSCSATSFADATFQQFGMGYSLDAVGGTAETLFIANTTLTSQSMLASLDTNSFKTSVIGNLQGSPELTGTGDANLFGFFPDATAPRIDQLDKTSAATLKSYPLEALKGSPFAWAFAFWGGDFWIFLRRDTDTSTKVWHLVTQTGQVQVAVGNTGARTIVGAGVSTCAPIMIQ